MEAQINDYKRVDNAERIRLNIEREELNNIKSELAMAKEANIKQTYKINDMAVEIGKYKEKAAKRKIEITELKKEIDISKQYTAKDMETLKQQYSLTITELENKIKSCDIRNIEADQTMCTLKVENEQMKSTMMENVFIQNKLSRPMTAVENRLPSPNNNTYEMKLEEIISKDTYLTKIEEIDQIIKNM
jgi:hypothetical protein